MLKPSTNLRRIAKASIAMVSLSCGVYDFIKVIGPCGDTRKLPANYVKGPAQVV